MLISILWSYWSLMVEGFIKYSLRCLNFKYLTPPALDDWYCTQNILWYVRIDVSNSNSHSSWFIGIFDYINLNNSKSFKFNGAKFYHYVPFNKDISVHTSVVSISRSCGSGNVLL